MTRKFMEAYMYHQVGPLPPKKFLTKIKYEPTLKQNIYKWLTCTNVPVPTRRQGIVWTFYDLVYIRIDELLNENM